jgi:hypothetical protein
VWAGVGADGGRGSGLEMLMSPAPRKRAMRRGERAAATAVKRWGLRVCKTARMGTRAAAGGGRGIALTRASRLEVGVVSGPPLAGVIAHFGARELLRKLLGQPTAYCLLRARVCICVRICSVYPIHLAVSSASRRAFRLGQTTSSPSRLLDSPEKPPRDCSFQSVRFLVRASPLDSITGPHHSLSILTRPLPASF